jgi:apolipoprotein D and lipocalin family protein
MLKSGCCRIVRNSLVLGAMALASACSSGGDYRDQTVEMTTVSSVDLTRYAGRWYEIARFPNSFEKGCVGVTADYALRPDGKVSVINTCRQGTLDGPVETAEGVARATDPSNAKLAVNFVRWLPFIEGDYWIIDLDPDYRVAVVGAPSGGYGWILARSPRLEPAQLEQALGALRRNGYDTDKIIQVAQPAG